MIEYWVSGELETAGAGDLSDGLSAVTARLQVALGSSDLPAAQAAAFQPVLDELLVLEEQVRAEQLVPDQHPGPPTPGSGGAQDLRALGTLVRLSITSVDLREALHRVAVLSAEAQLRSSGQAWASVIVGSPQAPTLLTCSSQHAQSLEALQFAAGEGPSFDAVDGAELVTTPDLCADQRWTRLRAAVHLNPTWCVAAPLLIGKRAEGVLSVYGTDSRLPVRDEAIGLIRTFAAAAQRLLGEAQAVEEITKARDQLEEALISRAVIDQAKGMVMMGLRCDADRAFQHLVRLSNARNQKLREIAASLVTGACGLEPILDLQAEAQPDAATDHLCQMGEPDGTACPEPTEVKLTDSWGDTAWSCLNHAEAALLGGRGIFLATRDPNGLAAYLSRRRRAVRSHPGARPTQPGVRPATGVA